MVQCVAAILTPDNLGHCQIHEHIWVHPTPMSQKNPALAICDYSRSLEELRSYRAAGGNTLVDAQPIGAGRDGEMLRSLSRESGVNIIACTGFHLLGFYPDNSWLHSLDEEELYRLYLSELTEGMFRDRADGTLRPEERTDIRAGMVKAAIPVQGATGRYETLLRAAARAAAEGGVPLMLHTEAGSQAVHAVRLCMDAGMNPGKIVVCHVDRRLDNLPIHQALAEMGVYLDYDTVGRFKYHDDAGEVALLAQMAPWQEQILLSLDTTAARLTSYGGQIGLCYLLHTFLPQLRTAGIPEPTIRSFCERNCQHLFRES